MKFNERKMIKNYKKKPVVVEAVQFTRDNAKEICFFAPDAVYSEIGKIIIPTLEGEKTAYISDYIIKGIKGEFYPCNPVIFEASYEEL